MNWSGVVPDDDVHVDQVDGDPEIGRGLFRLVGPYGRLRRRGLRGLASRRLSAEDRAQRGSQNQTRSETNSLELHTRQYKTNCPSGRLAMIRSSAMRVAVGADHAGFEMKRDLAGALAQQGHEILDLGTHSSAPVDYPDIAEAVAIAIRNGQVDRGIIVCGSGAGVAVAACKFPGVRAAVCHDCYTARAGGRARRRQRAVSRRAVVGPALARTLVETFLAATFSAEERHLRRLAKIEAIESKFTQRIQFAQSRQVFVSH